MTASIDHTLISPALKKQVFAWSYLFSWVLSERLTQPHYSKVEAEVEGDPTMTLSNFWHRAWLYLPLGPCFSHLVSQLPLILYVLVFVARCLLFQAGPCICLMLQFMLHKIIFFTFKATEHFGDNENPAKSINSAGRPLTFAAKVKIQEQFLSLFHESCLLGLIFKIFKFFGHTQGM